MTGRSASDTKKIQKKRAILDGMMARAVELYHHKASLGEGSGSQKMGFRAVCKEVQDAHFAETGQILELSSSTLHRLVNGGATKSAVNSQKSWLLPLEVDIVIQYTIEVANRGFPLSHKRLKEHVDNICRARLGDAFPAEGVGKGWTGRFCEKYSSRLSTYWSRPLDNLRGRAVNPSTNKAWFDLLGNILGGTAIDKEDAAAGLDRREDWEKVPIQPGNIYATDESGFQSAGATRERVIGGKGKKVQHQKGDGNRENTTVIVTICADGTAITPAVIFKGKAFQVKWDQKNPTNASLGHSQKGWTDGEIGVEWIKDFDEQTAEKSAGEPRLLLVDGHNSHYTRGFLEYARAHRIIVLCYPAHGTHVYQGLDVAVFGVLKLYWTQEKNKLERERQQKVSKTNFLSVYGAAHIRALTPETIKSAFSKTGVVPFDPSVVTEQMMAPSLETSCRGHLPLPPTTPMRVVTDLFYDIRQRAREAYQNGLDDDMSADSPQTPTRSKSRLDPFTTPVKKAIKAMASTSASFLITSSPVQSTSRLPPMQTTTVSPCRPKHHRDTLLNHMPETAAESMMQAALQEAYQYEDYHKSVVVRLQTEGILNGAYCDRVRGGVAAEEEKRKNKANGKLVGDGMSRYLSGHRFVDRVILFHDAATAKVTNLEQRRADRGERAAELMEWKRVDVERRGHNVQARQRWEEQVSLWKLERDTAKTEKRRPAWNKPTLKGLIIPPVPRPKAVVFTEGGDESERDISDEDNDESDIE